MNPKSNLPPFLVRGVTLLELVLVLVIVAIGGALAYPSIQRGIENQQAKKALETLRTISNAVRLYQLDKGVLPQSITDLENLRYINPTEYAPGFAYSINTTLSPFQTDANGLNSKRTITLKQDGVVDDSRGFLGSAV